MSILYLLVPLAILLAGLGVWAFAWAVRKGQFDDVHTPAMRMLVDEEEKSESRNQKAEIRDQEVDLGKDGFAPPSDPSLG